MSAEEILHALKTLFSPGDLIEVRFKRGKLWYSGYYPYERFDKLAQDVAKYDELGDVKGIYYTVNPVKDILLARNNCKITQVDVTTADINIKYRKYLPIDIDPDRPTGICGTDQQHEDSIQTAYKVAQWLKEQGWPEPIIGDSGNGAHLLYRIDELNTPEALQLVDGVLTAIIQNSEPLPDIKIEKWANAARIWRLYGTVNKKGDELPEMDIHHRRAKLLQVPDDIQTVTTDQLKEMAARAKPDTETNIEPQPTNTTNQKFDIKEWMDKHGVEVVRTKEEQDRTVYVLKSCLINPDHTGHKEASIVQFNNGKIGYKCHHHSCEKVHWSDVREKLEPGYKQKSKQPITTYTNERGVFIPKQLGDEILSEYNIITLEDTRQLLLYSDGVYKTDAEDRIRKICLDKLGDDFRRDRVNEAVEYIRLNTLTGRDCLDINTYLINVKNGMVNAETAKLLPHSPDYLSTVQLNVTFDPKAEPNKIHKFMHEVTDKDFVPLLYQYIGYCLTPDISQQKALVLDGGTGNGKSVFIDMVTALVGKGYSAIQSIQHLNTNRFATAALDGKLLNVFTDLPSERLRDNSVFKMVTGDKEISAEIKGGRCYKYTNKTHHIYSTNQLPELENPDEMAFYRRLLCVTFPNSFEGDKADKHILEKLTTEEELSGLFNIALIGLQELIKHERFCYNPGVEDIQQIYEIKSNPIGSFLETCTEHSAGYITKTDLYDAYLKWCDHAKPTTKLKENAFGRIIKKAGYVDGRLADGDRPRIWHNLSLSTECEVWLNMGCPGYGPCPGSVHVQKKTWTKNFECADSVFDHVRPGSHVISTSLEVRKMYSILYETCGESREKPGHLDETAFFQEQEACPCSEKNMDERGSKPGRESDNNATLKKSQHDYGQITMSILDDWYGSKPSNPVETRAYVIPELVRQTGISPEHALRYVTDAMHAKGWL